MVIHEVAVDRWKVFFIDYGHCFWNAAWLNGGYTHTGPDLEAREFHRSDAAGMTVALTELIVDCPAVNQATDTIRACPDQFLDALVDVVPAVQIDDPRRQLMKETLKRRRDDIATMTATWWNP